MCLLRHVLCGTECNPSILYYLCDSHDAFCVVQIAIHESRTVGDPLGRAVLVVQRIQGTQGLVNVRWRLNVGAQDDFLPPLEGSLQFTQVVFPAVSLASFGLQKSFIIIVKRISIA